MKNNIGTIISISRIRRRSRVEEEKEEEESTTNWDNIMGI